MTEFPMAREAIYQQSDPERRGNSFDDGDPSESDASSNQPSGKQPGAPPGPDSGDGSRSRGEADSKLRPRRMDEMVGQRDVIERLKIAIDAAQSRGEPLGHILFDGPPGLGKTTFATVIPAEMNTSVQMANGAGLRAPKDLLPYLTNVSEGSVLFIDEIHRVPKSVEEYLYTAMEDYRIDVVLGDGVNARTLNLELKPFTLIGATTRAGMLSAPLRDRFQIREHLGWYTRDELAEIVHRNAAKLAIKVDELSANVIADRSRSTPRLANNRLLWVRDYAQSKANGKVSEKVTCAALDMIGIDSLGLDKQDRNYLDTLMRVFLGGPAGLDAIAHTMNVSGDTLEDEVEPFLLRSELLVRTRRGRLATPGAYEHMQRPMPD
ncbi:MAG: Holliday junction branch migration DNA helicase RuvB [Rhodopirellula sp. JB044]|uniref:Holliday junction branch migration DNA helicase RuvB n=1 Tax=Rhodopirellula sp. JB044 TaxID=3342844 RepID=UPI00370C6EDE